MVGRLVSFWDCLFSGAMLNFGRVFLYPHIWPFLPTCIPQFLQKNLPPKQLDCQPSHVLHSKAWTLCWLYQCHLTGEHEYWRIKSYSIWHWADVRNIEKNPIFNTSTSKSIILSGWSVQTSTRFYNYHLVNTNDTNDTSKFNPRHWEVELSSRRLQDVSRVWHWQVSCDLLHYQVGSHHGHQVECPPRYLRVTQHHCITLIFFSWTFILASKKMKQKHETKDM